MLKRVIVPIITGQTATHCPDPKFAMGVFVQRFYLIVRNTLLIVLFGSIDFKLVTVIFIEAVHGTKPHKAIFIF
ncbi:hypothetical protein D3C73_945720 [compost metagenome]